MHLIKIQTLQLVLTVRNSHEGKSANSIQIAVAFNYENNHKEHDE